MILRILNYLKRPYPHLDMPWWKELLISCGVVFLLFVIFEPFGVDSSLGFYKWIFLGAYVLISAFCVELPRWLFPLLFGKEFVAEKNWTVGKNIFYNLFILLMIGIGIYLFMSIFFLPHGFRLSTFILIVWNTFLIGIFPVGLITVIIENRNMSRHAKEVAGMNRHLREGKTLVAEDSFPMKKIVLPDGLKDKFELEAEQLLLAESDGNYVKIVYEHDAKLSQRTLRMTMKQVEDAFAHCPFIQKCHRAFLVNLHRVENAKGNSQGYRLVMKGWSDEIPVSRAYNKEIRDKVEHLFRK
ncbi:LytTR family DNA-binding domain-containing protein [Phocaeicola sp.]